MQERVVSDPYVHVRNNAGIILPSELLELLTGAVGDLLVGRTHFFGVHLAAAKLALHAVQR